MVCVLRDPVGAYKTKAYRSVIAVGNENGNQRRKGEYAAVMNFQVQAKKGGELEKVWVLFDKIPSWRSWGAQSECAQHNERDAWKGNKAACVSAMGDASLFSRVRKFIL